MQFQLIIFTPLLWGIGVTSSLKYALTYQIQFPGIHYPLQKTILKWNIRSLVINKGTLWCRNTPESALLQICQYSTFAGKFAFCHYCIGTRLFRQSASRLQPWVALFSQTLSLKSQKMRQLKICSQNILDITNSCQKVVFIITNIRFNKCLSRWSLNLSGLGEKKRSERPTLIWPSSNS